MKNTQSHYFVQNGFDGFPFPAIQTEEKTEKKEYVVNYFNNSIRGLVHGNVFELRVVEEGYNIPETYSTKSGLSLSSYTTITPIRKAVFINKTRLVILEDTEVRLINCSTYSSLKVRRTKTISKEEFQLVYDELSKKRKTSIFRNRRKKKLHPAILGVLSNIG